MDNTWGRVDISDITYPAFEDGYWLLVLIKCRAGRHFGRAMGGGVLQGQLRSS